MKKIILILLAFISSTSFAQTAYEVAQYQEKADLVFQLNLESKEIKDIINSKSWLSKQAKETFNNQLDAVNEPMNDALNTYGVMVMAKNSNDFDVYNDYFDKLIGSAYQMNEILYGEISKVNLGEIKKQLACKSNCKDKISDYVLDEFSKSIYDEEDSFKTSLNKMLPFIESNGD